MEAVDDYIPDPKRVLDKAVLMPIEDVFSIQVFFFGNIGQLHLPIYSANIKCFYLLNIVFSCFSRKCIFNFY